jgi:hypothetical protein
VWDGDRLDRRHVGPQKKAQLKQVSAEWLHLYSEISSVFIHMVFRGTCVW